MKPSLDELLLVNDHVVAQVVEPELVVGDVGDITVVLLSPLVRLHRLQDASDGEAEEAVDGTHPLRVTVCQVVVDRDDADALALKRVEVGRQCADEGFSFTGFHFRYAALVKDDAADQLDPEMLHPQRPPCRLAADREGFREQVVERLATREPLLKIRGLRLKLRVRERHHLRPQALDPVDDRLDALQLMVAVCPE